MSNICIALNYVWLQRLASEPEMKTVAKELEMLVNELHPAADSRIDYEQTLRKDIFAHVSQSIQEAASSHFTNLTTPTELIEYQGNEANSRSRPEAGAVLHALDYEPDRSDDLWMTVVVICHAGLSDRQNQDTTLVCTET